MNLPEAGVPQTYGTPHNPRLRSNTRWWVHLLVIGAYPVVVGVLGWNRPATSSPALTSSPGGLLLACVVQLAVFAAIFAVGWLASRATRDELLLRWRNGLWPIPLGIAYSVALRFALGVLALLICTTLLLGRVVNAEQVREFTAANRPDVGALVDIGALRSNPLYFWLSLTLVSYIVAGLREELWRAAVLAACRALWPKRFSATGGQILAVALISVVFGLGHMSMGPVAAVAATLLGLGLGIIMVLHRSIWPAVMAHGMFDATTFALLPWIMERLPLH